MMTDPYVLIFVNSFRSAFMLPIGSEAGWFAARAFGGYNMALATVAAFTASVLSMFLNFGIGHYLAYSRKKTMFSEESYRRIHRIFNRYMIWIFLVAPMPLLGLLAALAGLFRLSFRRFAALVVVGRIAYYGYYLLH